MTPERWRTAEEVFQAAIDLPAAERTALLDARCVGDPELRGAVEGLLAYEPGAGDAVAAVVGSAAALWSCAAVDAGIGRRLGPYRITGTIGQGGMGTVYRAVRDDDEFHKEVAIKLVKRGMDTDAILRRFRMERQILARLEHPNIARLHDGGTTDDGLPYFVMECIDGQPVTDYCRARALLISERLQLFLTICHAVQHAHQNLVVHRDLKPTNIVVTGEGVAKLLDFGIAKLLADDGTSPATLTGVDARVFTPEYGSPEQVRGEAVATTTDVYQLGLILFELLTGVRAQRIERQTPAAIEEVVCRTEAPAPSMVVSDRVASRLLAGDLDNIVRQALQKEPSRRYQSAAALAEDIRRYLDDLPIQARPDTAMYRACKFARRHRGALAATAAVFIALATGGLLAVRQARIATARELQVRELAKVFLFDVHDAVRDLPGATRARQTIVDTAVRYLDALAASAEGEPELARELAAGYAQLGGIQGDDQHGSNVGAWVTALTSYRKAVAFLDLVIAAAPDDTSAEVERFRIRARIADLEARSEGPRRSLVTYAAVVDDGRRLVRRFPGDPSLHRQVADTQIAAARQYRLAQEHERARASAQEALGLLSELLKAHADDNDLLLAAASAESAAGMAEAALGHLSAALAHYRRAVELNTTALQRQPANVNGRRNLMLAYSHVGDVLGFPGLQNLGDIEGAERAYLKVAEIARELHDADPHDARAAADFALALMRAGMVTPDEHAAGKLARFEGSLAVSEALLAKSPENLQIRANAAYVALQLGRALRDRGRGTDAAARYRRALALAEPILATDHPTASASFVQAAGELALLEARVGRRAEALSLANRAVHTASEVTARHTDPTVLGRRHLLPLAHAGLAAVHEQLGDPAEARRLRDEALTEWKRLEGARGFTEQFAREARALEAQLRRERPPH